MSTEPSLDDLFRELLDLIAGECGVKPLLAPQQMGEPLHHTSDTDLYPLITLILNTMNRPARHCRGGWGIRCKRYRGLLPSGYCPRCHRRWLRRSRQERLEEYVDLTRTMGLSSRDAAKRVGVCQRTADRYEVELRAAEAGVTERRAA